MKMSFFFRFSVWSNPGGGEIFRSRPDRPWGPPSLLYEYNGYRVSFPGVKRPGRGVDHPPSSSARVKERVELYLCSPSGPSWPVLGRTLPLPLIEHRWNETGRRKPTYSGEKPVPVSLCPPQIPHGLNRDWTRTSAVRSRRLTAWVMARSVASLIDESLRCVYAVL
jgi:hypothetical protein